MSLKSWIRNGLISIVVVVSGGLSFSVWQQFSYERIVRASKAADRLSFLAKSLYAEGLQMGQATRNVLLSPENPKAYSNHEDASKNFASYLDQLRGEVGALPETQALMSEVAKLEELYAQDLRVQKELLEMARGGKAAEGILRLNKEETPLWRQTKEVILSIASKSSQVAKDLNERAAGSAARLRFLLIAAASVMLAIPLLIMLRAAGLFAQVHTQLDRLVKMVQETNSGSDALHATSESLAATATEQAAALQQTASSLEEISSMVARNTESAKTSAQGAQKSVMNAEQGKDIIQSMVRAIQELEETNRKIENIQRVFAEVKDKTGVIDDIVFQTQLLSFNASVEAARAGEHGKGFAVVAEEVGNLAEMSGNASAEINQLLGESLKQVEGTVEEVHSRIVRLVSEGGRSMGALDGIVAEAKVLSQKVTEIAEASQEQSRGIQEISRAMSQLDQTTQQNAASSQEASSTSEQLKRQADVLRESAEILERAIVA